MSDLYSIQLLSVFRKHYIGQYSLFIFFFAFHWSQCIGKPRMTPVSFVKTTRQRQRHIFSQYSRPPAHYTKHFINCHIRNHTRFHWSPSVPSGLRNHTRFADGSYEVCRLGHHLGVVHLPEWTETGCPIIASGQTLRAMHSVNNTISAPD